MIDLGNSLCARYYVLKTNILLRVNCQTYFVHSLIKLLVSRRLADLGDCMGGFDESV